MKKYFILLLTLQVHGHIHGQSLANTIWFGTNPPSPNMYFQFTADSVYYSMGSGYNAISTYYTSGSLFFIYDIPGITSCTDTGNYTYIISGSNLSFTEISDLCTARRNTLTGYNWTLISTAINAAEAEEHISIYPNPAKNYFRLSIPRVDFIYGVFYIYDESGRLVLQKEIISHISDVDVEQLPHGIYTGVLDSGHRQYIKIIK